MALLSYPRSGNHVARAFLEYGCARPTLGARNRRKDPPIHARPPNRGGFITITSRVPVALKCHSVNDLVYWRRSGSALDKLLVLMRPPSQCITSQVYRSLRRQWWVSDGEIRRAVEHSAEMYLAAALLYRAWPEQSRMRVDFADLIGDDETAVAIIRFAGGDRIPDRAAIARLREISRGSQVSLDRTDGRLYQRVRAAVAETLPDEYMYGEIASCEQPRCSGKARKAV